MLWSGAFPTIGITGTGPVMTSRVVRAGDDTLSRHGRARPGHLDKVKRGDGSYRDHRNKPGDVARAAGNAVDEVSV